MGHQYSREQNQEMDLRDYIRVIGKRKNILITAVLGSSLMGLLWSSIATKHYEVTMVIEPPGSMDDGIQSYDTVANVKAKIESGAFNSKIIKALGISAMPRLIVTQPKDTRLIKIVMKRPEGGTDIGVNILTRLMAELRASYTELLDNKRMRADNHVKVVYSQIRTKEDTIKLKNEELKILSEKEKQLAAQTKEAKISAERLLAKSESLAANENGRDGVAALLFSVTVQNNMAFYSQSQNELFTLRTNKETIQAEIENIKRDIVETRIGIENLNISKGSISNIVMIQEPLVSPLPLEPGKKEIVTFFAIIGLIAGFFCALFFEYWKRPQPFPALEKQPV